MDKENSSKKENEIKEEPPKITILKKSICEGIGTAALIFFGCGLQLVNNLNITCIAFGAIVTGMYYSIGNISGCHLNPALSLNLFIRKKMKIIDLLFYMLSQFIGAMMGCLLLGMTTRFDFTNLAATIMQQKLKKYDNNEMEYIRDDLSKFNLFLIEFILTLLLCMVYNCSTDKNYSDGKLAGLNLGITVMLFVLFATPYTGASMNPFRTFAPAIFEGIAKRNDEDCHVFREVWLYLLATFGGGSVAGFLYKFWF